jgi:predicted ATPase/transcriptional regulator with XRE-family HTH domain
MDQNVPVSFGEWVKRRRKSLDLTQKELAERVGCSIAALQKIERDERRPSRQMAGRIIDFLEVSPEQHSILLKIARGERAMETLPSKPEPVPAIPSAGSAPMRLPVPTTPLVGRETELAHITRLFQDPHCRLLTLTGSGGVGKTRLALEAARQVQDALKNGACFVSLMGVSAPEFMVPAIADALDFSISGSLDPTKQILNYLGSKQMLIVLDNFEHLLDGVDVLGEILQHAPDVKLLVTSRESLHLQAEWTTEVYGLPIPQTAQTGELASSSAARFFLQRARQANANFTLADEDRPALLRICQLVQGLPLALELAASWVRTLSCREIAREIERGLSFLAVTARDIPERHRSITAVFDHSWRLLSEQEQRALRQLSVFRGGFTREAAEQIAGANLPLLSSLVNKSLAQHNDIHAGRFELHELIRQYAAMRLEETVTEERATRKRHSQYYLSLLEKHEPGLRSRQQKETLTTITADIDNLRTAWDVAVSSEAIEWLRHASGPLYYIYELLQYFREAELAYKRAADMIRTRLAHHATREDIGLEAALGDMLNYQAFFNLRPGNNREALELFKSSMALLKPLNEPQSLAFAFTHSGIVHWAMGNFDDASRELSEGLSISKTLSHPWLRGLSVGLLGGVIHDMGRYEQAYSLLSESMAIFRSMGDPYFILLIGIYFSRTAQTLGRLSETHTVLQEGLQLARESGNRWSIGLALERLGTFAQITSRNEEAQQLLEESLGLLCEVGDRWSLSWVLNDLSQLALTCHSDAEAERYAVEAIRVATEAGNHPSALNALVILSMIRAKQNLHVPAMEMALHVLQHSSSTRDAKDRAERIRLELESKLTHDEIESVKMRTQPDNFADFIPKVAQNH